jgi:hypothetical protein
MPYWSIDDSGRREELDPQKAVEYRAQTDGAERIARNALADSRAADALQERVARAGRIDAGRFAPVRRRPLGRDRGAVDRYATGPRPGFLRHVESISSRPASWSAKPGSTRLCSVSTARGQVALKGSAGSMPSIIRGARPPHPPARSGAPARSSTGSSAAALALPRRFRQRSGRVCWTWFGKKPGRFKSTFGAADQRRLDEYLTALRDVERRIDLAAKRPTRS